MACIVYFLLPAGSRGKKVFVVCWLFLFFGERYLDAGEEYRREIITGARNAVVRFLDKCVRTKMQQKQKKGCFNGLCHVT